METSRRNSTLPPVTNLVVLVHSGFYIEIISAERAQREYDFLLYPNGAWAVYGERPEEIGSSRITSFKEGEIIGVYDRMDDTHLEAMMSAGIKVRDHWNKPPSQF